jgi:hypothetical protein
VDWLREDERAVYKQSPLLRIVINIQDCHQTMNIVTVDKVTFHLLSSHHGYSKRH